MRGASGRLKRLSVDKGLLRETESVQDIITPLVKCDFFGYEEAENEITLFAFRLLILDLLTLFQAMNEGTISILEHYFEMSKPDAERALVVYKRFSGLTERVVKFLSMARSFEVQTRIQIPRIKHAPTSLTTNLEEYLNDVDFETNRRQYLAQQDAKRTGKPVAAVTKASSSAPQPKSHDAFSNTNFSQPNSGAAAKGPSPDLIDFFESIEQKQQPMAQNSAQFQQQAYQQPQVPSFQPQLSNFPQQVQAQQPISQQSTNPFIQMQQQLPTQSTNPFPQAQQQLSAQSTNPFPQSQQQLPTQSTNSFPQTQQQLPSQQTNPLPQIQSQVQPQSNPPFPQAQQEVSPQSTNPFRQSMMPQATGQTQAAFQQSGSTNPFMQYPQPPQNLGNNQPFQQGLNSSLQQTGPPSFQQPQQNLQPQTQNLVPQRTGTNPFARVSPLNSQSPSQPPGALVSQATGSTNPFRQSSFVDQQTGTGWQAQQGTMGGLEQLETKPVFPRPGQLQPSQQGGWM